MNALQAPRCRAAVARPAGRTVHARRVCPHTHSKRSLRMAAAQSTEVEEKPATPQQTTEKYGLEAGLFKVVTSKDSSGLSRTDQAKQLLAQYGSAYLITSISLSIVSFSVCYAAVSAGVDVPALLAGVGLQVGETGEKVGTVALAYAAHKALSPVRFPPTVALTPLVARQLGRAPADTKEQQQQPEQK